MNPEYPEFGRGRGGGGCGSSGNTQYQLVNGFYGSNIVNERASIGMSLPNFSYSPNNESVIVDKHKLAHDKLKKKLYDKMVHVNNTNVRPTCFQNMEVAPLVIKQEVRDYKNNYHEVDGYSSPAHPGMGSYYRSPQSPVIPSSSFQNCRLGSPQLISRVVSPEDSEMLKKYVQLPKADFGVVFQRQIEGGNVFPTKINSVKFVVPPPAESCSFQTNKAQDTSKFQQTTLPSSSHTLAQGFSPRIHDASSFHPIGVPSGNSQQQMYSKEIHQIQQFHQRQEKPHVIQQENQLKQQQQIHQNQIKQQENHPCLVQQQENRQYEQHLQEQINQQHRIQQEAIRQSQLQKEANCQRQIQEKQNYQHQLQKEASCQRQMQEKQNYQHQLRQEMSHQHRPQEEIKRQYHLQQEINCQRLQQQQDANHQQQIQQELNRRRQIQQENLIRQETIRQNQSEQETNHQFQLQQAKNPYQKQQETNHQYQLQQTKNPYQKQEETKHLYQLQEETKHPCQQQETKHQYQLQVTKHPTNQPHQLQPEKTQVNQPQQETNCQYQMRQQENYQRDYHQRQLQQQENCKQRENQTKQEENHQQQNNSQLEMLQQQKRQDQNCIYKPKFGNGIVSSSFRENLNTTTSASSVYTIADCVKAKQETVVTSQSRQNVISFGGTKLPLPSPTAVPVHSFPQPKSIIKSKSTMQSGKPPCSIKSPLPITISMLKKPKMNDGKPDIDLNDKLEILKNNIKMEAPPCECFTNSESIPDRTPYYTHLGYGSSLPHLRQVLEERFELKGKAIRIEKLNYTGREGKTSQGCPIAKWIIRRSGPEEKVLVLAKHRRGHQCATAWLVIVTVAWEGVPSDAADDLYTTLVYKLTNFGLPTTRRCGINEQRTCACQGLDNNSGASFSFGCSWSMYYNGCKFARSKNIRKFRLSETSEELDVEEKLQNLATNLAPVYQKMAPDSYHNQTAFEEYGKECRLGRKPGRPWSGVTACVDFCAHSHKDLHNMNNGCTVVVTLTKHRGFAKPDDEQLHVLPLYVLEPTDEFGSEEGQLQKMADGSLEILRSYPMELRIRKLPLTPCRRRGKKKKDETNTPNSKEKEANHAMTVEGSPLKANLTTTPEKIVRRTNFDENFKRPLFPMTRTVNSSSQLTDVKPDVKTLNKFENFCNNNNNNNNNNNIKEFHDTNAINVEEWRGKLKRELYANVTNNNQEVVESSGVNGEIFQSPLHLLSEAVSIKCRQYDDQANTATLCDPNGNSVKLLFTPVSTPEPSVKKLPDFVVVKTPPQIGSPRVSSPATLNNGVRFNSFSPTRPVIPQSLLLNPPNPHQTLPNNKINKPTPSPDVSHLVPSPNPESITRVNNQQPTKMATVQEKNMLLPYFPFFNDSTKGVTQQFCLPSLFTPNYSTNMFGTPIKEEPLDLMEAEYSTPPPSPSQVHDEGYYEIHSENEENFSDGSIGGVAIALSHGSVLFECAKHELHATTALKHPSRLQPTRISLVFYQHKNLNLRHHGEKEYERKMELKRLEDLSMGGIGIPPKKRKKYEEDVVPDVKTEVNNEVKVPTQKIVTGTTMSWVTVFPFAPLIVTGPYQKWI